MHTYRRVTGFYFSLSAGSQGHEVKLATLISFPKLILHSQGITARSPEHSNGSIRTFWMVIIDIVYPYEKCSVFDRPASEFGSTQTQPPSQMTSELLSDWPSWSRGRGLNGDVMIAAALRVSHCSDALQLIIAVAVLLCIQSIPERWSDWSDRCVDYVEGKSEVLY